MKQGKCIDRHTKFFLAAIIIIPSVMVLLWVLTSGCIKRAEQDISGALDNVIEMIELGDDSRIETSLDELNKKWKHHSDCLLLFLNHSEINEVELGIVRFCSAVRSGDADSVVSNSDQIKSMLEMMRCYDEISIRNIL